MTDQFKKFLILFPSLGVGVWVYWLLWFLLGVIVSGSGEPCYGCIVFIPIFFVPSVMVARISYLFLVKKIITNKYQNITEVQEKIGDNKNTHNYFFEASALYIFQLVVFYYPSAFLRGIVGLTLMFIITSLGFVCWPFILKKQMSLVKKRIFLVLFFCSPVVTVPLVYFLIRLYFKL